jgi:hypothetical protein
MEISPWIETPARCTTPSMIILRCKANSIQEQERTNMENNLEGWCERLLEMNFEVGFNEAE